jgi:hypothetical protein
MGADYKQVVGTEIETKADGSMFKLVRYPQAGYCVSTNSTAEEDAPPPSPYKSLR